MSAKKERKPSRYTHWFNLLSGIIGVALFVIILMVASYGLRQTMRLFLSGFLNNSGDSEAPNVSSVASRNVDLAQLSHGSFTELFSSMAWADAGATTAYRDNLTTSISLNPAYEVKTLPDLDKYFSTDRILSAVSNGNEILLVDSGGNILMLDVSGSVPYSSAPLVAHADLSKMRSAAVSFDAEKKSWLVVGLGDNKAEAFRVISDSGRLKIFESRNLPGLSDASLIYPGQIRLSAACSRGDCLISASSASLEGSLAGKPVLLHLPPYPASAKSVVLPPDIYDISPVSIPSGSGSVENSATKESVLYLATARLSDSGSGAYSAEVDSYSGGRIFGVPSLPPLASSYRGLVRLAYDSVNGHMLFVYSAYFGQAKEYLLSGGQFMELADYGKFMGPRVLGGDSNGDLAVPFEISPAWSSSARSGLDRNRNPFSTWWLFSGYSAKRVVVYRLSGGLGNELTGNILGNGDTGGYSLLAGDASGGALCLYYGTGGSFRAIGISNRGFDTSHTVSWVSSRLNLNSLNTAAAEISRSDDNSGILSGNPGASIKYYLTNDDGLRWYPVKVGDLVKFSEASGGIRFRIDLTPGSGSFLSPWIDQVGVEYWLEK